jgi:hypothetical protein
VTSWSSENKAEDKGAQVSDPFLALLWTKGRSSNLARDVSSAPSHWQITVTVTVSSSSTNDAGLCIRPFAPQKFRMPSTYNHIPRHKRPESILPANRSVERKSLWMLRSRTPSSTPPSGNKEAAGPAYGLCSARYRVPRILFEQVSATGGHDIERASSIS